MHKENPSLDWNGIRYFVALVERQTLTAAAETLQVQHSTVARQVAQLENHLGVKLFDRLGKRRYRLTADGEHLYQYARELYKDVGVFTRAAREQAQALGEVSVSAPPLVAQSLLMPHFAEFTRRCPNIRLNVQSDVQLSNLHMRQADIALRAVMPTAPDLVARRLRDIRYHLYAHQHYLATTPRENWGFLMMNVQGDHGLWLADLLANERVIFSANDFALSKQAIAAQTGIGLLPDFYVRPEDGFVQVEIGQEQAHFATALYLVMHEDVRRSVRVRTVADFLIEKLAEK